MTSPTQPNKSGLLANGKFDFEWLNDNSDELLCSEVAKGLIKRQEAKVGKLYLEIRNKTIRFSRRINGKPVRINLGSRNYSGINYSLVQAKILINSAPEELEQEKAKRAKRQLKIRFFSHVCDEYECNMLLGLEKATIKDYKTQLNRIKKYFEHINIDMLKHTDIEIWVKNTLASKELSAKSVSKMMTMLKSILKRAVSLEIISIIKVDFDAIHTIISRFKKVNPSVCDTKTLGLDDLAALENLDAETLKTHGLEAVRNAALLTATSVATRSGETRAIALQDVNVVDDGEYTIDINRSCVLESYKRPKNQNKQLSTINVFESSAVYLERLVDDAKNYTTRTITLKEANNDLCSETLDFLVVNPSTGLAYTEYEYRRDIYKLQKLAGIDDPVPPKQLRHTAARMFNEAGIDVKDYSKQFTHVSHKTTIEFYGGKEIFKVDPDVLKHMNNVTSKYFEIALRGVTQNTGKIRKPRVLQRKDLLSPALMFSGNRGLNKLHMFKNQELVDRHSIIQAIPESLIFNSS